MHKTRSFAVMQIFTELEEVMGPIRYLIRQFVGRLTQKLLIDTVRQSCSKIWPTCDYNTQSKCLKIRETTESNGRCLHDL